MTRVDPNREEAQELSPEEHPELRDRTLARAWERWDRQIEQDATKGKLEPLFERALEAHRRGQSRKV